MQFGYKEFDVVTQKNVYKPTKFYTGINVGKSEWDAQTRTPFNKRKLAALMQIEGKIRNIFEYLDANGKVTPDLFKAELNEKIKGKESSHSTVKRVRLVDFIEREILTSNSFTQKTKDGYKTIKSRLIEFEEKIGKPLYVNDMNEEVYLRFMNGMRERYKKINSVWSIKKDLTSVLNKIKKKYKIEVFNPNSELDRKDKITSVDEDKIYLNFEQIKLIMDYEPPAKSMQHTKMVLLTLIFAGCRYSDVFKVKPEHHFVKNGTSFYYAQFITQKGKGKEVIVPILKPLMALITANNGQPAERLSLTSFNNNVKLLLKAIAQKDEDSSFNQNYSLPYTDAEGNTQFETKKFYDFVSSHTGRRSFVTNLINYIPVTILTKITAHELTQNSVIYKYDKVSLIDNAVRFVKELKRVCQEDKEHFVVELV